MYGGRKRIESTNRYITCILTREYALIFYLQLYIMGYKGGDKKCRILNPYLI